MMNPLRRWCVATGTMHIILVVAMYATFYDEFISDEMERLPIYKLTNTAFVLMEIATCAVYAAVIVSNLPPPDSHTCSLTVTMAACVTAACGWVILCVFSVNDPQHFDGVAAFTAGTIVYTAEILWLSHLAAGNAAYRDAMFCVFATLYLITIALFAGFAYTHGADMKPEATRLEWATFLSLALNYTLYFVMHPFNAGRPLVAPLAQPPQPAPRKKSAPQGCNAGQPPETAALLAV